MRKGGRGSNGKDKSRTRRDFYARHSPNSRSYGIGPHKLKSTRALAREGIRRALSFRLLLFLYLHFWRSCNVHREAVQLQLHTTYLCVSHLAVCSSHGSSLSAHSLFFSNLSLPVFLVFVRLNDAIPRDQMRIRFTMRALQKDRWLRNAVDLVSMTRFRYSVDRSTTWPYRAQNPANTIYEIISLQRIMSRCGISRIRKGKEGKFFYAEISRRYCNLRRVLQCDLMKSVSWVFSGVTGYIAENVIASHWV